MAIIGLMLVASGCQTESPSPPEQRESESQARSEPGFPYKLRHGVTLDMISLADDEGPISWKVTGEKLPHWIDLPIGGWGLFGARRLYTLVTVPKSTNDLAVTSWVDGHRTKGEAQLPISWSSDSKQIMSLRYIPYVDEKPAGLLVHIATHPWKTLGTYAMVNGFIHHASGYDFRPYVDGPTDSVDHVGVKISFLVPKLDRQTGVRLVIKDFATQTMIYQFEEIYKEPLDTATYFVNDSVVDHCFLELQTRPFQSVAFANVHIDGPTDSTTPKRRLAER